MGALPCPVVLDLVDYWAQCPPTHLMLKEIAKQLGMEFKDSKHGEAELTEAEKWATAGVDASTGAAVATVDWEKVPATVREFIIREGGTKHA